MKRQILCFLLILTSLFSFQSSKAQQIYGNDFWFSFVDNLGVVGVSAGPASTYPFRFVIVSVHKVTGTITAPNLMVAGVPWSTTFTVAANSQTTVTLPYNINGIPVFTNLDNTIEGKGFHITTDSLATVYAVNDGTPGGGASTDGEVVLPTTFLDKDYVINSRSSYWAGNGTKFNVIATQNNTTVNIKTLKYNGTGQVDVSYGPIVLNAGQTYQSGYFISTTAGNNGPYNVLTGTVINADKPIAVIGTTTCGGADDCGACDVMMAEQLPISQWGTKYIIAQPIKRTTTTCGSNGSTSEADYIEVVGKVGQTITITNWNGTTTKTITAIPGSGYATYGYLWYDNPFNPSLTSSEFNGESNLILSSSQPFGVVQYQKGWQTDNLNNTDPEATVCYPESIWSNSYLAGTASLTGGSLQDIVIIIDNTGVPSPISTMTIKDATTGVAVPVGTTVCPAASNAPPCENCWQAIKGPVGTNYMFFRAKLPVSGDAYFLKNTSGKRFGFYFTTQTNACSYVVQGGGGAEPTITVPVEFLDFKAEKLNGKVVLSWITGTEKNSESFLVERSKGGGDFYPISSRILAAGNSSVKLNYSFMDLSPEKGISYYRISQKDFDGKIMYSEVKAIEFEAVKSFEISSSLPNPTSNKVSVSFRSQGSGMVNYQLRDLTGRLLINEFLSNVSPGENKFDIDLSSFDSGIYYLSMILEGEENSFTKIIKQ